MSIRLPRLPSNWKEQPQLFERYYDQAMSAIEKTLNEITAIPSIQAALETLDTVVADAQSAIDNVNASADAIKLENSLVSSYVQNASAVLSADSTGLVTIAAHTRIYGDPSLNPSVSVAGGSLSTGAAAGSTVRVYYVDASRSGGSVTYLFTVDPASTPAQGNNNHSVGAVVIPSTGTNDGVDLGPPGYIYL